MGWADEVRDIGVRSAVISRWFFMLLSVVGGVGTAVVYWVGGLMTIEGVFTIGTIVAFGAYLRQLYSPLMALTNAPVEFVTSMVSFERVFEVLDLPIEIEEKPDAVALPHVEGAISFEHVYFDYTAQTENTAEGLEEIARLGPRGSGEVLLKRGRQRSAETDDDSDDTDTEQMGAQRHQLRD